MMYPRFCKKTSLCAAIACACVLVIALVGCSAGGSGTAVSRPSDESISAASDRLTSSSSQAESSSSSVEPSSAVEEESSAEKTADSSGEIANFVALSQMPELPNGCEITSLAAVLNYYEYNIDKGTLSDVYLQKAPVGQANFYQEFVGDPRDGDAYGCYSPVIVDAANSYLSSVGSSMSAHDISGASPEDLYARIDAGQPVIVWATRYMEAGHYSVTWNVGGQSLTWYTPEHCLVLVGYDRDTGTVQLADPLEGAVVSYDMELFEQRFGELKNQAVVIE